MKTIVDNIELKVRKLIERCNQLKSDKKGLEQDNQALNVELQEKKKKNEV